ncbi:MAG TPA: hypothetical protein PK593_02620 [Thermomicrobiales bacterium]|nr:hypothetical protein [Thermomicrobiales bacterium]
MNARPLYAVLLCLLLLAGCAGFGGTSSTSPTAASVATVEAVAPTATAATATATTETAASPTATPTEPSATPAASPEGLQEQFAEIERRVVDLRGLTPTMPIEPRLISRQELRQSRAAPDRRVQRGEGARGCQRPLAATADRRP